jgi:hypothetical protein
VADIALGVVNRVKKETTMAKVTIRFHETTPQQRRKMIKDLAKRLDVNGSLEELITTLRKFEDKYGMSTVEFYARFMAGKMGDSHDFVNWAGAFVRYQRLLQAFFIRQSKAA